MQDAVFQYYGYREQLVHADKIKDLERIEDEIGKVDNEVNLYLQIDRPMSYAVVEGGWSQSLVIVY